MQLTCTTFDVSFAPTRGAVIEREAETTTSEVVSMLLHAPGSTEQHQRQCANSSSSSSSSCNRTSIARHQLRIMMATPAPKCNLTKVASRNRRSDSRSGPGWGDASLLPVGNGDTHVVVVVVVVLVLRSRKHSDQLRVANAPPASQQEVACRTRAPCHWTLRNGPDCCFPFLVIGGAKCFLKPAACSHLGARNKTRDAPNT